MKRLLSLFTLLFLVLFTFGCEKKISNVRKKYVGTWEMTITNNSTHFSTDMGGNTVVTENTSVSVKEVEISIDESNKNGLIFQFPGHQPKKVRLTSSSNFQKQCNASSPVISGHFQSKKKMTMSMSNYGGSCYSYSAGGYSNQTVVGVKK